MKIEVDDQDFGTICVCALRYAMGRATYMPSLVRDFVRPLLPKLTDNTIGVMLNDCESQSFYWNYGHEKIDKPGWVQWHNELRDERERRSKH